MTMQAGSELSVGLGWPRELTTRNPKNGEEAESKSSYGHH